MSDQIPSTTITVRTITQHPQQGQPGTAQINDVFIPKSHPDHDRIVQFVKDAVGTVDDTDLADIGVDVDAFDFRHCFDLDI